MKYVTSAKNKVERAEANIGFYKGGFSVGATDDASARRLRRAAKFLEQAADQMEFEADNPDEKVEDQVEETPDLAQSLKATGYSLDGKKEDPIDSSLIEVFVKNGEMSLIEREQISDSLDILLDLLSASSPNTSKVYSLLEILTRALKDNCQTDQDTTASFQRSYLCPMKKATSTGK